MQRIQESRVHIFSPPQFSASLEDLMVMQAEKFPGRFGRVLSFMFFTFLDPEGQINFAISRFLYILS